MVSFRRILRGSALLAAAFAGGVLGSWIVRPEAPQAGPVMTGTRGDLVATFGVGGVVTRQGELWQYRPDKSRWVTLDESFALEGQATGVVPLPVPPERVHHMETFGFLVTDADECWLYNLDQRRWENIGRPPIRPSGR
jgi:hypothetical protein